MYAVITTGGKQYRVQEGDVIKFESIPGDVGASITFDKVLLLGHGEEVKFGRPYIEGCTVAAEVVSQGRHKKIHIVKFRRRKHHEKWQGHRQNFTEVRITQISE